MPEHLRTWCQIRFAPGARLSQMMDMPGEYLVMIIAAMPVSELRGAIPLALSLEIPIVKAFGLAVLGNIIPVVPLLFLLAPVSNCLRKFKIWAKFFDWLFERTRKKADLIEKYAALGLAIFVAIPLPFTGAWTGTVAASLFRIRFRYAFIAIATGVILAGLIVSSLCALGIMGWEAIIK